jgi:hypothetical protein
MCKGVKLQTNFQLIIDKKIYKCEYDIKMGNILFFSFLPFELHSDLFNDYYTKIKINTNNENNNNIIDFDDLMKNYTT